MRDLHLRSLEGVGSTVFAWSNGDGQAWKASGLMSFFQNNVFFQKQ
jgi:hypothetical protein